jgi:hypothetical protein
MQLSINPEYKDIYDYFVQEHNCKLANRSIRNLIIRVSDLEKISGYHQKIFYYFRHLHKVVLLNTDIDEVIHLVKRYKTDKQKLNAKD